MDLLLQFQTFFGLLSLLFLYKLLISWTESHKKKHSPEVPGGLPIIGHLYGLRGPDTIFQKLGLMADQHGPAFIIRLGMRRTLVVSSWEVIKECFTTNDKILAAHPASARTKYMGYSYAMTAFAPYGPYWREMRKISTVHLLSNSRLEMLKHVWVSEINTHIKDLYVMWVKNDHRPIKVDIKQWLRSLAFKVIIRLVTGKQFSGTFDDNSDEEQRFREAIDRFFYLATRVVVSDMLPFLEWMDWKGQLGAMKRNAKELDSIMESFLQEHRRSKLSGEAVAEHDFMYVLMSILEDTQFGGYDPYTIVKATSLGLILGGTETTSLAMQKVLSLVLNKIDVLKKAQDELDIHVGKDRQVDDSDIKNLPYFQAIVKEMFRLSPPTPAILTHEANEECQVGGLHVPRGTQVIVNVWKLQRDPRVWLDPLEFKPERFVTSHVDVDVRGQHFECIPFGSGRRACPGISFSLQFMHLAIARLFQGFELASPNGAPIEMAEGFGLKKPMEILLTPRLPSSLY
ncbi:xanthotoxin 5-hydroxylase CYP82C2-like [Tasmannia lanceolata]|uniref:xanthotoxin 5-hydroxylase CYP82C2-like n=1 Tax=Tasmannia lanceolata TaxID=3420 RepID=UPI004062DB4B